MSAVLLIASIAALAAYVCRVDRLSWLTHPVDMLAHVLGGAAASWCLTESAQGRAGLAACAALAVSVMWLVATFDAYRHAEPVRG